VLTTESGYDARRRSIGQFALSPTLLTPVLNPSRSFKARCPKHRAFLFGELRSRLRLALPWQSNGDQPTENAGNRGNSREAAPTTTRAATLSQFGLLRRFRAPHGCFAHEWRRRVAGVGARRAQPPGISPRLGASPAAPARPQPPVVRQPSVQRSNWPQLLGFGSRRSPVRIRPSRPDLETGVA
jgi:hypothetical protein